MDKTTTVSPMQVLSTLTPAQVTGGINQNQLGFIPIGVYKGQAAFWDLDQAVNQPLVHAESLQIMKILDGRLAGYDMQTLTVQAGAAIDSIVTVALTVPTTEVWFVNDIVITTPADDAGGARAIANFRISFWQDNAATPSALGQAFDAVGYGGVGGVIQHCEFFGGAPFIAVANKPVTLRLPAST
ncbi:MAG: hypothetical protein PHI12_13525, partial [Dehalococcoidales bacterium]|nr:hypothetical protein [Dehalococcoidales bacterium]